MASMPLSIPLRVKIKGLKSMATLLVSINNRLEILMTSAEQVTAQLDALNTRLDNIAADVQGLKDAAAAKEAADAATIQTLRDELAAAIAGTAAEVAEAVTAAVDNAEASFAASLQPIVDKAAAIDEQTPPAQG